MKPTVKILVCVLAAGSAWGQNPSIIQNTRNSMNAVSNNTTAASDEALGIKSAPAPASSSPAPVQVRTVSVGSPAAISPKNTSGAAAKTTAKTTAKTSVKTGSKTAAKTTAKTTVKINVPEKKAPVVAVRVSAKPRVAPVVPKVKPSAKQTVAGAAAATRAAEPKAENEQSLPLDAKYAANGRRDPFISPVVSRANGSSCTSGKKCLEIGAINLKGVVHGESGFIAVVSNGLNKAYFLRENDPVFNGYVVKITGDSIVFQETLQDRLGKSFTREVVKKITTPAV
jgi:Tfp pilus assembly protein PilP